MTPKQAGFTRCPEQPHEWVRWDRHAEFVCQTRVHNEAGHWWATIVVREPVEGMFARIREVNTYGPFNTRTQSLNNAVSNIRSTMVPVVNYRTGETVMESIATPEKGSVSSPLYWHQASDHRAISV